MSCALQLAGVEKSFRLPRGNSIQVLKGINLDLASGEIVSIVGRSGSGKSTLLNILGLLESLDAGSYHLGDQDTAGLPDAQKARLRGAHLGFVFQQFHLMDRRTALENVAEPFLHGDGAPLRGRLDHAFSWLEKVGLADRADSMPHLLSGGEQQRVAIARALVREPRIILADEVTGSLDTDTGERIYNLLLNLVKETGVSMVIVTHDDAVAAKADRMLRLRDGMLEEA